jgi:DNA-binding transcriptional LysR family regulator
MRNLPNLQTEMLCTSKVNALLSPGHRLASCESLRVQDLTQEHLLLIGASTGTRVARELMFHVYGMGALSVFESNLPETILRAAEMGLGIALLADSFSYQGHALKAIPLLDGDKQVSFQIAVAWNRERELSVGIKNFIHLLKDFTSQLSTDGPSSILPDSDAVQFAPSS